MTSIPSDPTFRREDPPPKYDLLVRKHPHDRENPEKPWVVKVDGEWFAQLANMDEFPEGYMCRRGLSQQEALGKVPELLAALARRKLGWTEE